MSDPSQRERESGLITSTGPDPRRLQDLLSETFDVPVEIASLERLAPWYVVRCQLVASERAPKSVIVKWLREEDPSGLRKDPQQMFTERVALEFLGELALALAPRLLATDLDSTILVLEDLAPRVPLAAVLQRQDPDLAEAGLTAFARAMGELHGATAGHDESFYARRSSLGPVDAQLDRLRFMGRDWMETWRYASDLGAALKGPAEAEMASVISTLADPGAFLTLSNGDAAANNYLVKGHDGRLIDFEFAGYRHALVDVACLYVPGPIWITVSDPITSGLEAEYRHALSVGVPEASDDDLFGFGIGTASIAFAVERFNRFPKVDGRSAGDQSRTQLISTLESAAFAAESHDALVHLTAWIRKVSEGLRRRWPDADVDFTEYASYVPRHVGWWRDHGFA